MLAVISWSGFSLQDYSKEWLKFAFSIPLLLWYWPRSTLGFWAVFQKDCPKEKKKKVFGCCLMLQLSQCSSWLSKSSSAAWHHPWPCSCTLLSAMAAVLIQQSCSQLFLLFRGKLMALGFFVVVPPLPPCSFLGHIMLWLVWCFCTVY